MDISIPNAKNIGCTTSDANHNHTTETVVLELITEINRAAQKGKLKASFSCPNVNLDVRTIKTLFQKKGYTVGIIDRAEFFIAVEWKAVVEKSETNMESLFAAIPSANQTGLITTDNTNTSTETVVRELITEINRQAQKGKLQASFSCPNVNLDIPTIKTLFEEKGYTVRVLERAEFFIIVEWTATPQFEEAPRLVLNIKRAK